MGNDKTPVNSHEVQPPPARNYTADDFRWRKDREDELRAKYGNGDGVDWSPEGQAFFELQHGRELLPDRPAPKRD